MGQVYRQFSLEDRLEIARLSGKGRSIRQIAAALDRAPSSVARELKRNTGRQIGYKPVYADQQAAARRWSGSRLDRDGLLRASVRYNNTPRKCLLWKNPAEVFSNQMVHFERESTSPPPPG